MHRSSLLQGIQAVIIRNQAQSQELLRGLASLGADVTTYPVMEIVSLPLPLHIARSHNPFASYDSVVWTSQNAVTSFFSQLSARQRRKIETSKQPIFACVGRKTSEKLKQYGAEVHFMPSKATALHLALEMQEAYLVAGWNILFPCSTQARQELPEQLTKAQANVERCTIYEPKATHPDPQELRTCLQKKKALLFLFASPSAVRYFIENIGHEKLQENLDALHFASIGKTTAEALNKRAFPSHIVPDSPGISSLLLAIEEYFLSLTNKKKDI